MCTSAWAEAFSDQFAIDTVLLDHVEPWELSLSDRDENPLTLTLDHSGSVFCLENLVNIFPSGDYSHCLAVLSGSW